MGIPLFKTTGVHVNNSKVVSFDIDRREFNSLPCEGIFFLDVRQDIPLGTGKLPIAFSTEGSEQTSSLLKNGLQEEVPASDLQLDGRYLIYYNKCSGVYQLVNAYTNESHCYSVKSEPTKK